jgi:hypothetical protein
MEEKSKIGFKWLPKEQIKNYRVCPRKDSRLYDINAFKWWCNYGLFAFHTRQFKNFNSWNKQIHNDMENTFLLERILSKIKPTFKNVCRTTRILSHGPFEEEYIQEIITLWSTKKMNIEEITRKEKIEKSTKFNGGRGTGKHFGKFFFEQNFSETNESEEGLEEIDTDITKKNNEYIEEGVNEEFYLNVNENIIRGKIFSYPTEEDIEENIEETIENNLNMENNNTSTIIEPKESIIISSTPLIQKY